MDCLALLSTPNNYHVSKSFPEVQIGFTFFEVLKTVKYILRLEKTFNRVCFLTNSGRDKEI